VICFPNWVRKPNWVKGGDPVRIFQTGRKGLFLGGLLKFCPNWVKNLCSGGYGLYVFSWCRTTPVEMTGDGKAQCGFTTAL